MKKNYNNISIEKQTVELMIKIYCRQHNDHKNVFCVECGKLREYAFMRLDKCPYGKNKPACRKCKTHCYEPSMRKEMIKIMRFSAPRMIYKHPIYTLHYILKKVLVR